MSVIMPPKPGEDVHVLAAKKARLAGKVTRRGPQSLTIELEEMPIRRPVRFVAGAQVSIEWRHVLGVMQLSAKVEDAQVVPRPTLTLEPVGEPEPIERREHDRVPIELPVSAWTLAQPTWRLAGNTVDLTADGALLRLPDLSPVAATVDMAIALPDKPLHVAARVVWRRPPDLVGVHFDRMHPEEQVRLVEFLREPR